MVLIGPRNVAGSDFLSHPFPVTEICNFIDTKPKRPKQAEFMSEAWRIEYVDTPVVFYTPRPLRMVETNTSPTHLWYAHSKLPSNVPFSV